MNSASANITGLLKQFAALIVIAAMVNVAGITFNAQSLDATINGKVDKTVKTAGKEINQHIAEAVPLAVASHQMLDLDAPLALIEGIAWLSVNARAMTISRFWGGGSNFHMELDIIAESSISFGSKPSKNNIDVRCQLSGSSVRSAFTVPLTMHLPLVGLKTADINQSCQNAKGGGALAFIPVSDKPDRVLVLIRDGAACKPLMYISRSSAAHPSARKESSTTVEFNNSLVDLL